MNLSCPVHFSVFLPSDLFLVFSAPIHPDALSVLTFYFQSVQSLPLHHSFVHLSLLFFLGSSRPLHARQSSSHKIINKVLRLVVPHWSISGNQCVIYSSWIMQVQNPGDIYRDIRGDLTWRSFRLLVADQLWKDQLFLDSCCMSAVFFYMQTAQIAGWETFIRFAWMHSIKVVLHPQWCSSIVDKKWTKVFSAEN